MNNNNIRKLLLEQVTFLNNMILESDMPQLKKLQTMQSIKALCSITDCCIDAYNTQKLITDNLDMQVEDLRKAYVHIRIVSEISKQLNESLSTI